MKGIFGTDIFKGSIRGVFEGMLRVSSIGVLGYIEGYIWYLGVVFCGYILAYFVRVSEGIFVVVRVYWRVYLWVYLLLAYTRSFIGGYI